MTQEVLLAQENYFPTTVYTTEKPEFVNSVKSVAESNLPENRTLDEIYPVLMSGHIAEDPQIKPFADQILKTAWTILDAQGYDMKNFGTYFTEMWMQEHHKHSLMEQHAHAFGVQLVGFYFLETPEDCSVLQIHDPRPGKVQIGLPQKDMTKVTSASDIVHFKPYPGLVVFTNSWLNHSFGRHASDKPIKFIHFNIGVMSRPADQQCQVPPPPPQVEII